MLGADRRRRHDPLLEWKVRLFSVAAVFLLAGMYLEERWMTGIALALLLGAMLLRFAVKREDEPGAEDELAAEHEADGGTPR